MLATYATAALILAASLLLGRAILGLLGWPRPVWLSGAAGLAALVVVSPFLVRLPGRALTAAVVVGIACALAALVLWRRRDRGGAGESLLLGGAVTAIAVTLATLPFLFNDGLGVLGEGIYTNDHAAQLYWSDWLRNGFGPEPNAVSFGYPVGPQAVAVIAAEATGSSLVDAFNGLLLAIPALTALAALAALGSLAPGRRIAVAAICGLPYLGASFLAQSAFKETAMALFVLAFALALASLPRVPWRAVGGLGLLLAAASVFTFSIPGLAWFALAVPLWLAAEALAGRSPVDWRGLGAAVGGHRAITAAIAVALLAIAAIAIGPAIGFVEKIDDVQASAGRLGSPVFWGEAFGIWPEGDFRIVRGEVSGSLLALALGALALGWGLVVAVRRRELALPVMLVAGGVVYVGARLFAEIHVEAKALAVIAPLALLVALRGLLGGAGSGERGAGRGGWPSALRQGLGFVVLVAAFASTVLALRAAPVGYDARQAGLERLAEKVDGASVAFLGVDRFSGYYLRGTLMRAPAGYVPEEIEGRPEKQWQQGLAADFDTLEPGKLDKFRFAITTAAAYGSSPPPNFKPVRRSRDYVLWRRETDTPRARVLADEGGNPGALLDCESGDGARFVERGGLAVVLAEPTLVPFTEWDLPAPVEPAAGGQERGFAAPGEARAQLELPVRDDYELSLQYHSQARLEVLVDGELVATLPPSLDGMYISAAGRGAFWPAGEVEDPPSSVTVTVRALEPDGLEGALGDERRVWLGDLAASPIAVPEAIPIRAACGEYVDRVALARGGGGGR